MNNIEWLDSLSVSEIKFVHTYVARKKDYPMKNSGRYQHGLLYTVEGTEQYNFSDKTIRAEPNTVLYLPKNESYTIDFQDEKSVVICIDFNSESLDVPRPFCVKFKKYNEVKAWFLNAEKAWLRKEPSLNATCKSILFRIIGLMIENECTYLNSKNYFKIEKAVDYLHAHYLESSFRIDSLFKIAQISPKYFETLFFKEFNVTPKEYVCLLKIEYAKQLLKSEKCSVGDIAFKLGYSDTYHFSKFFKQKTGYTPTEFRRWSN